MQCGLLSTSSSAFVSPAIGLNIPYVLLQGVVVGSVFAMVSHFNYWSIVIAGTLRAMSAVLWVGGARLVPVRNSFACAALTRIVERFRSVGLLYTITTPSPRFCISRGSLLVH